MITKTENFHIIVISTQYSCATNNRDLHAVKFRNKVISLPLALKVHDCSKAHKNIALFPLLLGVLSVFALQFIMARFHSCHFLNWSLKPLVFIAAAWIKINFFSADSRNPRKMAKFSFVNANTEIAFWHASNVATEKLSVMVSAGEFLFYWFLLQRFLLSCEMDECNVQGNRELYSTLWNFVRNVWGTFVIRTWKKISDKRIRIEITWFWIFSQFQDILAILSIYFIYEMIYWGYISSNSFRFNR